MKESLMYKMSYFRFPELFGGGRTVDRVRQQDIPESPTLDVLDEAFTSENWIVRPWFFFRLNSRRFLFRFPSCCPCYYESDVPVAFGFIVVVIVVVAMS